MKVGIIGYGSMGKMLVDQFAASGKLKNGSLLVWVGRNWKILAAVLCAAGLVIDFAVYMARWRPFRVWASFFRRRREKKLNPDLSPAYEAASAGAEAFSPDQTETAEYTEPAAAAPERYPSRYIDYEPERSLETEEIERRIVRSGKRRRSSRLMDELNEGMPGSVPPVDEIIHSDEAYYQPVYPKNWREQENQHDQ